jgi:hypothetical protein
MAAGIAHSADLLGYGMVIELFILGRRKNCFSAKRQGRLWRPPSLMGSFHSAEAPGMSS